MYLRLLLLVFLFSGLESFAQRIRFSVEERGICKWYADSILFQADLDEHLLRLRTKGFAAASIDTIRVTRDTLQVRLYKGERFVLRRVQSSVNGHTESMHPIAVNKLLTKELLSKTIKEIAYYYECSGFPFVKVIQDSITFRGQAGELWLQVNTGLVFRIDTIIQVPSKVVSLGYLQCFTDIKKGRIYNQKNSDLLSKRLRSLNFLQERSSPKVLFHDSTVNVVLFLEPKKANGFEGILGFQQNPTSGKLNVTGDLAAKLVNTFKRGEEEEVVFKGLANGTRNLDLAFSYPYLANTAIGIAMKASLYKQDSQFVRNQAQAGIQYLFPGANFLELFARTEASSALSVNKKEGFANYSKQGYGLSFFYQNCDDPIVPKRGLKMKLSTAYAFKKIQGSIGSGLQWESALLIEKALLLPAAFGLNVKLREQSLVGKPIVQNELLRIGGLRTLRGFDEQSIPTSTYAVAAVELRRFIDEQSFFALFYDQGMYRNEAAKPLIYDAPFGLGLGITLKTKTGIITLDYAIGKQFQNPLSLQQGKVHFGVLASF